ncbi:MAG: sugar O-acyltransferase (sialic acid O-acetyltransferase NeuD family) [Sphingobacteriales bacterium]|jgi:sugar O-acyltransferase (sialic acid O-acetyltransferase NeuD family)
MIKPKIILIGGGGHCKSVIDVIENEDRYEIAGIVDSFIEKGALVLGYPVLGTDDNLAQLIEKYCNAIITVGQIKSAAIRIKLFEKVKLLGGIFPVIISKNAYVSKHSKIGDGTVVMHQALINANAVIGENCILNTGSLIEHDAIVGDNVHVSTKAILNGSAKVGNGSFIGSNSMLYQGVEIGPNALVPGSKIVRKNFAGEGLFKG